MNAPDLSVTLPSNVRQKRCPVLDRFNPELILFVLLNALDLVLTMRLLQTGGFYESNPFANYFLSTGGLLGMVTYKTVIVVVTLSSIGLMARLRQRWARYLLNFGSIVIGSVVIYSSVLMFWFVSR